MQRLTGFLIVTAIAIAPTLAQITEIRLGVDGMG